MTLEAWATRPPRHRPKEAGTPTYLPEPPTDEELTSYIRRRMYWLIIPSLISMAGLTVSQVKFATQAPWLYPFILVTAATLVYYTISLAVNLGTKDFDYDEHVRFVTDFWQDLRRNAGAPPMARTPSMLWPERDESGALSHWAHPGYDEEPLPAGLASAPGVDVFMPVCGEPIQVLRNAWTYISELWYPAGKLSFYVLDDSKSDDIREMAAEFGFHYVTRPDNKLQKAGNMHHAFWMTYSELETGTGQYVLIFDADFCPRRDMLRHLVPYMASDYRLGVVQSPQYFRIDRSRQNWLERGASAVQELFYRYIQQSREQRDAAICVGTNAVYRRRALAANGGPTQIGHSEDVHTGFDLRTLGWKLKFIPVNLATGTCPAEIPAFLAQQYRWCMGSMSLLGDKKFRDYPLPWRTRFGYYSGFAYYMSTALMTIVGPLIPLILLIFHPELIVLSNYWFILPSVIYSLIIFPLWHHSEYGLAAFATRFLYGWAHLFALTDAMRGNAKAWSPTGGKDKAAKSTKTVLFDNFRRYATVISGGGAVAWVGLALWRMLTEPRWYDFAPMFALGMLALAVAAQALVPAWRAAHRNRMKASPSLSANGAVIQLKSPDRQLEV
jgi:cellulose synthase (UDP-forming)